MLVSFSNPFYLIFLFVIPLVIFFHFFGIKNIRGRALRFANFNAIARIKGVDLYSKKLSLLFFDIFFVVILVLSLSGLTLNKEVDASSFSFVIAIDSSESMGADDISPDRLSAAKKTAIEFIESSPYDSPMGVISFSGDSTIEQDLTRDKQNLKLAIEGIEVGRVSGTDVYEAVFVSTNMLKSEKEKAVILISDGQINTENIYDTIGYASDNEVLVHTIAIGTKEGGEFSFGFSKVDEDSLRGIAFNTGGKFFSVESERDLKQSFDEIIPVTRRVTAIDLSGFLIMAALVLFIARGFLVSINKVLW